MSHHNDTNQRRRDNVVMMWNVVLHPVRATTRTADAVMTATAAVGSATAHGIVGGIAGTVAGVREGLADTRTRSGPAGLTVVAIWTLGLVELPLILAIGGTVLAARGLARLPAQLGAQTPAVATVTAVPAKKTAGKPRKSTHPAQPAAARRTPP